MKICIIGTGTMAKGIVKAFAAKMPVVMKSRSQASIDKAMGSISKSYAKLVEKGKMTQDVMDSIMKTSSRRLIMPHSPMQTSLSKPPSRKCS